MSNNNSNNNMSAHDSPNSTSHASNSNNNNNNSFARRMTNWVSTSLKKGQFSQAKMERENFSNQHHHHHPHSINDYATTSPRAHNPTLSNNESTNNNNNNNSNNSLKPSMIVGEYFIQMNREHDLMQRYYTETDKRISRMKKHSESLQKEEQLLGSAMVDFATYMQTNVEFASVCKKFGTNFQSMAALRQQTQQVSMDYLSVTQKLQKEDKEVGKLKQKYDEMKKQYMDFHLVLPSLLGFETVSSSSSSSATATSTTASTNTTAATATTTTTPSSSSSSTTLSSSQESTTATATALVSSQASASSSNNNHINLHQHSSTVSHQQHVSQILSRMDLNAKKEYLSKLEKLQGDFFQVAKNLNVSYSDLYNELEYQIRRRDIVYYESFRSLMYAYSCYFETGNQLFQQLEGICRPKVLTEEETMSTSLREEASAMERGTILDRSLLSKIDGSANSNRDKEGFSDATLGRSQFQKVSKLNARRKIVDIPPTVFPSILGKDKLFGMELSRIMIVDPIRQKRVLPKPIQQMFALLSDVGVKSEGIFRIPGDTNYMETLRDTLESGNEISDLSKPHLIHSVSGLFKQFFRDLPEPLMTFDSFDTIVPLGAVNAKKSDEEIVAVITDFLTKIPQDNYEVLYQLCKLLSRVHDHSEISKMAASNVGVVFGMNLFRPKVDDPVKVATNISNMNRVTTVMVSHFATIFSQRLEEDKEWERIEQEEKEKQRQQQELEQAAVSSDVDQHLEESSEIETQQENANDQSQKAPLGTQSDKPIVSDNVTVVHSPNVTNDNNPSSVDSVVEPFNDSNESLPLPDKQQRERSKKKVTIAQSGGDDDPFEMSQLEGVLAPSLIANVEHLKAHDTYSLRRISHRHNNARHARGNED